LDLSINEPPKQGDRIRDMLASFKKYTSEFEDLVKDRKLKICANQPLDPSKVPLGLLEPIFGSFCDLSTTINPTEKDNYAFLVLRYVMLKRYDGEKSRETALLKFFCDHFKIHLQPGSVRGTLSQSDDHVYTTCGKFIHLLVEVKNEITGINSDPYFQTPLFYRDYLEKLKLDDECNYLSKSAIPVMIIIVFGKHQTA
jgi:hypothetical protein